MKEGELPVRGIGGSTTRSWVNRLWQMPLVLSALGATALGQIGVVTSWETEPPPGNQDFGRLHVIDSTTNLEVGRLDIYGSLNLNNGLLDCVMLENEQLAYVVGFTNEIWVVDVSTPSAPALKTGPSGEPGVISVPLTPGNDLVITRDQRFALVCDHRQAYPVSVIDLTTWTVTDTASPEPTSSAVDISEDGDVFVTSDTSATGGGTCVLSRLTLSPTGQLSDPPVDQIDLIGERGFNVYTASAPYKTCVALSGTNTQGWIKTFSYPDLTPVDSTPTFLGSSAVCGVIHPTEDVLYVRTADTSAGLSGVERWFYSHLSGMLGNTPTHTTTLPNVVTVTYSGLEQMALSEDGTKLYCCDELGRVTILDASDLSTWGPPDYVVFNSPLPSNTQGICFATASSPLSVELQYFVGRMRTNGWVELNWGTASELDNAGFNVFRQPWEPVPLFQGDLAVLVNPTLVPARGTPFQPAQYRWMDRSSQSGSIYYYWLEDIDMSGEATIHGPIAVR